MSDVSAYGHKFSYKIADLILATTDLDLNNYGKGLGVHNDRSLAVT
jgi:hypothetical protein